VVGSTGLAEEKKKPKNKIEKAPTVQMQRKLKATRSGGNVEIILNLLKSSEPFLTLLI
jgi:hypothetical protein